MEGINIVAVIPARSGSKSIPDKNIMSIQGKPLMAYSIEQAMSSQLIQRTIVSTDSAYYAEIAKSFGAEVPFLRPAEISGDHATDYDVFKHLVDYLINVENYFPDLLVHLRPTYPIRKVSDIDSMINLLLNHENWDAVRSVCEAKDTPYKMWKMNNGILAPVMSQEEIAESYNKPRQILPKVYLQNASIDVTRANTVLGLQSMTGKVIGAYLMDENYDIDYFSDLDKLETAGNKSLSNKTFCFDIDGVIAKLSPNNDYNLAEPNQFVIDKVNKLYENNNTIILFTARGSKTGINWEDVTAQQMKSWGVKYHELKFGKPAADYYIDDRLISINNI